MKHNLQARASELPRKWLVALVMIVAIWVAPWANVAAQDGRYKQQVAQFKADIEKYEKMDEGKLAEADIALVRQWVDDAEVLLAKGDTDAAKLRLKRAQFGLELVGTIVTASEFKGNADKQEQAYHKAKEAIEGFRKEIEELQKKKQQLQSEIKRIN